MSEEGPPASGTPAARRQRRRALLACLLLFVAFFVVPVEPGVTGARMVLRALATLLTVAVVVWLTTGLVRRQISVDDRATATASDDSSSDDGRRRRLDAEERRSLYHLGVALVAGILTFALGDYVVAISAPEQFVNLRTRIDALYFSLATVTTIGYGDVHPAGQLARVVVCLQMVFSIGIIATGVSILFKRLSQRPPPPPRRDRSARHR